MVDHFQLGKTYRIHYPTNCLLASDPQFSHREVYIRGFRDLLTDPLTIDEFLRRPLLRRSRWIIKTADPNLPRKYRQFYIGSCQELWRDTPLRIGWYDPKQPETRPLAIAPFNFPNTTSQRLELAKSLVRWRDHQDPDGLVLRVFCDDLRIRRAW